MSPSSSSLRSDVTGYQYPAGRWRLATIAALDRATLWVGHIAIRHESSQVELFRPPGWRPDAPNPKRSVEQALALAEKVQAEAARAPETFEKLAAQHSEDVASSEAGGMLGGVRAGQLNATDFLDALAVLKVGEISKTIRTPYGFHILKRYAPPPEELVCGDRIVIGYERVYGLVGPSRRSRAEALQLAKEIAARAKKDPSQFTSLVDRYSENVDRVQHGDLGVYSTRDPGYFPGEVHLLAGLKVGDVGGPIDSRFGFEILKRTPASPRQEYALTAIEVSAQAEDPNASDSAMARAAKTADDLVRTLRIAPDRFRELQQQYCCDRVQRWTKGRGDVELTEILDHLSLGEMTRKPLRRDSGYMIMRRLDPATLAPEAPRTFEVPAPTDPDYEALLAAVQNEQVVVVARALIGAMRESSSIAPGAMTTIERALEKLADYVEQNDVDRPTTRAAIRGTLTSLGSALDGAQFSRFEAFARRWIVGQMMPPGSSLD